MDPAIPRSDLLAFHRTAPTSLFRDRTRPRLSPSQFGAKARQVLVLGRADQFAAGQVCHQQRDARLGLRRDPQRPTPSRRTRCSRSPMRYGKLITRNSIASAATPAHRLPTSSTPSLASDYSFLFDGATNPQPPVKAVLQGKAVVPSKVPAPSN